MRKAILIFILATSIFALTACGDAADYQYSQTQKASDIQDVQEVEETNGENAETENEAEEVEETYDENGDTDNEPNVYQGIRTQEPPSNEIVAGTIQTIDEMSITIDTSSVFVATGPGNYQEHIATGEPPEPQQEIIRLTEQTIIEVQASVGGQIAGSRAGTLDDLSLGIAVMAEGEWLDDEFVATTLTIMNF
ncbi:MAG: hypothetical protein FWD05_14635 [Oscillospiraceae bacterium]|nr:hypothetical protein [Oscillospiraceae bacterium]